MNEIVVIVIVAIFPVLMLAVALHDLFWMIRDLYRLHKQKRK